MSDTVAAAPSRRQALAATGSMLGAAVLPSSAPRVEAATAPGQARQAPAGSPALAPLPVIMYNRLAFGPRPGDIAGFSRLPGHTDRDKLHAWVEEQLRPELIDDAVCDAHLSAGRWSTLTKPLERLWIENYIGRDNDPHRYDKQVQPFEEAAKATLVRAVYSHRQLYEQMVAFWHNHFSVDPQRDGVLQPVFMHYDRDVIRSHALGNFRTMLQAVATSPEMLYYLDNA